MNNNIKQPVPCCVLASVYVSRWKEAIISGVPISTLTGRKTAEVPTNNLTPDKPFMDVGNAYFRWSDKSGEAMKAVMEDFRQFVKVLRLVKYNDAILTQDGTSCEFGVEIAVCDEEMNALKLAGRLLRQTEEAARALFVEKQKLLMKRRDEKPMSAQSTREESMICSIQALAAKSDAKGKTRHEARIAEIRAEQLERTRQNEEGVLQQSERNKNEAAAFARLLADIFPNVTEVKTRMINAAEIEMPGLLEELRRAMKLDCTRLGIPSPVNTFAVDVTFAKKVLLAAKAKSPVKRDQIETVLNWFAKGYEWMTEREWREAVKKEIGTLVKPSLGETISKRFKLKSQLKGAPGSGSRGKGKG